MANCNKLPEGSDIFGPEPETDIQKRPEIVNILVKYNGISKNRLRSK